MIQLDNKIEKFKEISSKASHAKSQYQKLKDKKDSLEREIEKPFIGDYITSYPQSMDIETLQRQQSRK